MLYLHPLVYRSSSVVCVCVCVITRESCWLSHGAVVVAGGDDALAWTLWSRRLEELI